MDKEGLPSSSWKATSFKYIDSTHMYKIPINQPASQCTYIHWYVIKVLKWI